MSEHEKTFGNQLESDPGMYPGTIAEKSGDKQIDRMRAAGLLKIVDEMEQGQGN